MKYQKTFPQAAAVLHQSTTHTHVHYTFRVHYDYGYQRNIHSCSYPFYIRHTTQDRPDLVDHSIQQTVSLLRREYQRPSKKSDILQQNPLTQHLSEYSLSNIASYFFDFRQMHSNLMITKNLLPYLLVPFQLILLPLDSMAVL